MWIKAAVLRDPDLPYQIEDVELRDPHPGEVRVRVIAVGLCHTDLLPRISDFSVPSPSIMGHEAAGVVDEVGAAVTTLLPGDHVVVSFDSCRACSNCRSGHPAYCDSFVALNLTGAGVDGDGSVRDASGQPVASRWFGQSSFATHTIVAARNVVRVDPSIPLELAGPLGCGVLTGAGSIFSALDVARGASTVVFGVGAVGLSAVMAARVAGANPIVAVDRQPDRLALAQTVGATHTFHSSEQDLTTQLRALTRGGAQYTLDTTGVPAVIQIAIKSLRPTGTCGLVGAQQGDLVLGHTALAYGRNVKGILVGDAVPEALIPRLIELWQQGQFPFDKLITTFPLDQINEAERASVSGEIVKPVLIP